MRIYAAKYDMSKPKKGSHHLTFLLILGIIGISIGRVSHLSTTYVKNHLRKEIYVDCDDDKVLLKYEPKKQNQGGVKMSILLVFIGLLGLTAGILMLVSPSTWQKCNEKANAILFSTDNAVTGASSIVGIILVIISLYILWSAYRFSSSW